MFRREGAIPPINKERFPGSVIVFDTEATRGGFAGGVEMQSFRFGVATFFRLTASLEVEGQEWVNFDRAVDLVDFIIWHARKDKTLHVYAHNLKYDLQLSGALTEFLARGWGVSLFVTDDPPTFIRLKRGRSSILMVDTFNYWQFSLAKMGDQLQLSKLTMPPGDAPFGEWVAYCKRDVEVLTEYLLSFMRFLQINDLSGLGLTVASQAFRSFRHRFMRHEITIHNDPSALTLERDGYTGGRVEAFHIGSPPGDRFYKLDVNSMYPFVMYDRSYPVNLVSYSENVPVSRLAGLLSSYYCLADCEVDTLEAAYAYKNGVKLIFPTGYFQAVLHHDEIAFALHHLHIKGVKRIALYNRQPIFTDYVDFFYRVKVEAERNNNPVLRQQAKIFLNSLYGKFGQREAVSKIIDLQGDPRFGRLTGFSEALGQAVSINYLGHQMEIRYKGGESYYSFPAIAGAVTANARLYLWGLVKAAGLANVFYVDTDSLIVSTAGFDRLQSYLDPERLGALKLEGESDRLIINGAKDYIFGSEVKHKGVPKAAVETLPGVWLYEQFRGFKTWLSEGLPPGVAVYQREKMRRAVYDKGVVAEGGNVSPLLIGYG